MNKHASKHVLRDGCVLRVDIEQPKIHPKRQDSFWYDGRVAVCNGIVFLRAKNLLDEFVRYQPDDDVEALEENINEK